MPAGPDGHCNFSFDFIDQFHAETDWTCQYCGCKVWDRKSASRRDNDRATIDHKIPPWRGGTDDMDNLLSACQRCNTLKGSLTHEEFIKFRGNELLLRVIRRTLERIKLLSYRRSQKTGIPETIYTNSFLNNRFEEMSERQLRFCLVSHRRRRQIVKSMERHIAALKYFATRQVPVPENVKCSIQKGMKRARCKVTDDFVIEVRRVLDEYELTLFDQNAEIP